jgi:DNA (cytosine-5)-methyltransferase 3A
MGHVDLLLAGSPCQGFSFSGNQLAFDHPQSKLFFEFIRLLKELKEINPNIKFLLENVRMEKEHEGVITEQISLIFPNYNGGDDLFGGWVKPMVINSSLVSAQSRTRLYWFNWECEQPKDKGIVLKDVLEEIPTDPTFMSKNFIERTVKNGKERCLIDENQDKAFNLSAMEYAKNGRQGNYLLCDDDGKPIADLVGENGKKLLKEKIDKSTTLMARDYKGFNNYGQTGVRCITAGFAQSLSHLKYDCTKRVYSQEGKSPTLTTMQGGHREPKVAIDIVALNENQKKKISKIETTTDKSNCITTAFGRGGSSSEYLTSIKKKTMALEEKRIGAFRGRYLIDGKRQDHKMKTAGLSEQMLEIREDYKSNTLTTVQKDNVVVENMFWRKLTPIECERLQTLDDNTTLKGIDNKGNEVNISNTQRYKMLGNGWTVDVIAHILNNLKGGNND